MKTTAKTKSKQNTRVHIAGTFKFIHEDWVKERAKSNKRINRNLNI